MTLELIAIIASSSVIVAIAPILIKHWQEASFLRKNKYERINEAANALVTSLVKLFDQYEQSDHKESEYADVITHHINWDSTIRPLVRGDALSNLDYVEDTILEYLERRELAHYISQDGRILINKIRDLTKTSSKRSRVPIFLVYVSLGVISGLISAILLLYWAGYTWHF